MKSSPVTPRPPGSTEMRRSQTNEITNEQMPKRKSFCVSAHRLGENTKPKYNRARRRKKGHAKQIFLGIFFVESPLNCFRCYTFRDIRSVSILALLSRFLFWLPREIDKNTLGASAEKTGTWPCSFPVGNRILQRASCCRLRITRKITWCRSASTNGVRRSHLERMCV